MALSAETDDPLYQQSQQLKKQGRMAEALATFLKVIEKRGEQASPESNLEAGIIYYQHTKDPIEAIHYLRKYLEMEPNSQQAPLVRQKVELARRELFRSMPGRPSDDQAGRFGGQETIDRLQRENDQLRAEVGRQPGHMQATMFRTTRGPVEVAAPLPAPMPAPMPTSTPGLLPAPVLRVGSELPLKVAPPPSIQPDSVAPRVIPAPVFGVRQQTTKPVATPTRPGMSGTVAGRRHTVAQGEGLYRIGVRYGVKVEAILAVNREVLPAGVNTKLTPGMELKIP